jgi:hypothetical protein
MTQAAPPRDEIGADDPELPKGDRAITPVPGRLGAGKGKAIILAALIVGSGALLGLTWERDSVVEDGAREPARQIVDFEADSARPSRPTLTQPGLHPPILAKDSATIVPAIEPSVAQPAVDDSRPATRRLETASPLLVYSRQTALPATSQALRKTAPSEISSEAAEAQPSPTPSILRAGRLPNRNFLILAGTNLPCVLATALDSTIPGQVSCVTPRDVLSDNGTTVLLDIRLAQALSERLGYLGQRSISRSRPLGLGPGRRSMTESEQRRPFMLPQELIALPENQLIVLRSGISPVRAQKLRYYRLSAFKSRVSPPPIVKAADCGEAPLRRQDTSAATAPKRGSAPFDRRQSTDVSPATGDGLAPDGAFDPKPNLDLRTSFEDRMIHRR